MPNAQPELDIYTDDTGTPEDHGDNGDLLEGVILPLPESDEFPQDSADLLDLDDDADNAEDLDLDAEDGLDDAEDEDLAEEITTIIETLPAGKTDSEVVVTRPRILRVVRDVLSGVTSKEHRYLKLAAVGLLVIALLAASQLGILDSPASVTGAENSSPAETRPELSDVTSFATGGQIKTTENVVPSGQAERAADPAPSAIDYDVLGVRHHIVQDGENLFRIGLAYGLTADEIAAANGIADPSLIYIGQDLIIPVRQTPTTEVQQPAARSPMTSQVETNGMPAVSPQELGTIREVNGVRQYCVNQGDTLWGLSLQFGTTVDVLAGANGIDPNVPGSLKMATWIIIPPQG